jgi:hypothetical protein
VNPVLKAFTSHGWDKKTNILSLPLSVSSYDFYDSIFLSDVSGEK